MNKATIKISIDNCLKCPFHESSMDPDPYDSFCSDDMKVVCNKTGKTVTSACRPYNLEAESSIPNWCPFVVK